jgi:hypothetical protein
MGLVKKDGLHPSIPRSPKVRFWVVADVYDQVIIRTQHFRRTIEDHPIRFSTHDLIRENCGVKVLHYTVVLQ